MSRNINVNPGNYKVAGRERQGEAIHQSSEKGAYAQQREEVRREAILAKNGAPAWETTQPNLEIPDRPKQRTRKNTRKAASTRKAKRTRKATPRRKTTRVARSRKNK